MKISKNCEIIKYKNQKNVVYSKLILPILKKERNSVVIRFKKDLNP